MTEYKRKLHREAMRRYRERYPEKARARYRKITARRRAKNPEHMKAVKQKSATKRNTFYEGLKRKPCMDCGRLFPPCVMEFDHVRGIKYKPVSQLRACNFTLLMEEVSKCDLVCSNCHRMRTHKEDIHSFLIKCSQKDTPEYWTWEQFATEMGIVSAT